MAEALVSSRFLLTFVKTLLDDVGRGNLFAVLKKDNLPTDWVDHVHISTLDETHSAEVYAGLQMALRTYYGRGARGSLIRIGGKMWDPLLTDAAIGAKAQAALVRGLPTSARHKPALELLSSLMRSRRGEVTVHTLDRDFLLVDHASPTTLNQKDSAPICFVTLGLIREALYWAVGREHDVEETSCRAAGARDCEFKITAGGSS